MPTLKESLAASKELAEGPTLGNMHPDARAQAIARASALHGGKSDGEQPGASLAIPDGWKLVPVEPTFEMLDAYSSATMTNLIDVLGDDPEAVDPAAPYRAMLSASPSPAQAAGGWQPIESAPKDGTHVLIANDSPGSVHPREGYYVAPEHRYENEPTHVGWWRLAGSCEERVHGRTPTHWMPLPAPPAIAAAPPAAPQGDTK